MLKNSFKRHKWVFKCMILILTCAMIIPVSACAKVPKWLNICTYNIYKCVDYGDYLATGKNNVDVKQVADFILEKDFDIVGLQEVDVNRKYSANTKTLEERDQPKYIAEYLTEQSGEKYYYCYAPTLVCEAADKTYENEYGYPTGTGLYGIAIISKFPIVDYRVTYLGFHEGYDPADSSTYVMNGYERRALLIAEIRVGVKRITVINTHFDLKADAREKSYAVLQEELKNITTPVVFMGDLNTTHTVQALDNLDEGTLDCLTDFDEPTFTFPSNNPNRQIDWVFVSDGLECEDVTVHTEVISDHLPVSFLLEFDSIINQKKTS